MTSQPRQPQRRAAVAAARTALSDAAIITCCLGFALLTFLAGAYLVRAGLR